MRERISSDPLQSAQVHLTAVNTQPNPDAHYDYGYAPFYWVPSFERIVDIPRPGWLQYRRGVRRRRFAPVHHEKRSTMVDTATQTVQADNYWSWTGSAPARLQQGLAFGQPFDLGKWSYDVAIAKLPAPDTNHYNRWKATRPSMESKLNLSVSLAELRDIKRMWDILPARHFSCRNWREVLHYANGQHLNWNFGWRPFLSDVKETIGQICTFEKRLEKLLNGADRPLMKRFRDQPTSLSQTWEESLTQYPAERVCFELSGEVKHTSNFHYSYDLPPYGADELRSRAWLDALGINPGIDTIWQLLPWSFVVDWFYNVGGLLEASKNDWVSPWVTWYQAGYSQHAIGTIRVTYKFVTQSGLRPYPALTTNFSLYRRVPAIPNFSGVTESLDADKIRLGASLMISLFR